MTNCTAECISNIFLKRSSLLCNPLPFFFVECINNRSDKVLHMAFAIAERLAVGHQPANRAVRAVNPILDNDLGFFFTASLKVRTIRSLSSGCIELTQS